MLKKILVIICIVIYSVVSYASLAASDGSSFISRKEFENVVSDFDHRLSTFEAGLNSKIDSQVTSYLDRNGIWSGRQQTLLTSTYITKIGESSYGTEYYGLYNPPNSFTPKPNARWEINDIYQGDFIVPDKPGMLTMSLDTVSGYNSSSHVYSEDNRRSFYFYISGSQETAKCDTSKGAYYAFELYEEDTGSLKMSIPIADPYLIMTDRTNNTNQGLYLIFRNFSGMYKCFVTKNKKLKYRLRLKYNINNRPTGDFIISAHMGNPWFMRIKNLLIY